MESRRVIIVLIAVLMIIAIALGIWWYVNNTDQIEPEEQARLMAVAFLDAFR